MRWFYVRNNGLKWHRKHSRASCEFALSQMTELWPCSKRHASCAIAALWTNAHIHIRPTSEPCGIHVYQIWAESGQSWISGTLCCSLGWSESIGCPICRLRFQKGCPLLWPIYTLDAPLIYRAHTEARSSADFYLTVKVTVNVHQGQFTMAELFNFVSLKGI